MATTSTPYGIDETISGTGVVAESLSISSQPRLVEVPNQKGAVVEEIKYDEREEVRLTVHGAKPTITNGAITIGSTTYIVDSCDEAGTYNQIKRWNITAHRYANCGTATDASSSGSGNT